MSNPCDSGRSIPADTAALHPERAFVVEFSIDGGRVRDEGLSGRVEHVVSGRATRFASAGELLAFVQRVLRAPGSTRRKVR